jgi:hypothetical protein
MEWKIKIIIIIIIIIYQDQVYDGVHGRFFVQSIKLSRMKLVEGTMSGPCRGQS